MHDHESVFNAFASKYFKLVVQYFNTLSVKTTTVILILNKILLSKQTKFYCVTYNQHFYLIYYFEFKNF